MRILHITPRYWPAYGGAEAMMHTIAEWTASNSDNQVDLWTTDADEIDAIWFPGLRKFDLLEEIHNNVHIRRFKTTPFLMNNLFINKAVRYLLVHNPIPFLRILGTPPTCFEMWMQIFNPNLPKYDVVRVQTMPYFSLMYIARAIARKTGAKFYIHSSTHLGTDKSDPLYKKYFDPVGRQFYRDADKIFVHTDAERRAIQRFMKEGGMEISDEKFEKVGVGIDVGKVISGNGEEFRKKYSVTEPIVFTIAAKVQEKGVLTLVKAMEKLWKKGVKAKLVLVGSSTLKFEEFWKKQSEMVKANTINLDSPSDQEKFNVLSAGDVFSMVSKSDALGIVYLEAWANKKPVIGGNIEAIGEVISDGKDGYLVNFDDVEGLANRIEELLNNQDLREQMGKAGYAKLIKEYTWERVFQILDKYFNSK
ncbi:glycosyltransferase family 4 protein [bacterium]|nr:glycosyltransferase family 4 protein [bacterium]